MTFFLGIDGGGTKTSCVVGDGTANLGAATAGGCNIVRLGAEQARTNLQAAIRRACENANLPMEKIGYACIGAAGVSGSDVRDSLERFIGEILPAAAIKVVGDHDIAFEAAFGGEAGVIVAAGTGSIALGRNSKGETARAGGHGFAISDEGSGHWIGRTAVAKTLAARDAGEATLLDDLIAANLRIRPSELVSTANAIPPPDFASLVPAILSAADEGDTIARAILDEAGTELARLARVVINRLWANGERVRVAMVGGVFENSSLVCTQFADSLRACCPSAEVLPDISAPLLGALSLARKAVNSTRKARVVGGPNVA